MCAEQPLQWGCAREPNEPQIAALRKFPVSCGSPGQGGQTNGKHVCGCFEEVVVRGGFSEEVTSELSSE